MTAFTPQTLSMVTGTCRAGVHSILLNQLDALRKRVRRAG